MSKADLLKRLEALKAKSTPAPVQSSPAVKETPAVTSNATNSNPITATKELIAKASEAVPTPAVAQQVAPEDIKRIIDNIDELKLSEDAKGIAGFKHDVFEYRLNELNLLQDQTFPEINRAIIEINKDLRQHPELAHLLSPAQIAVIVRRILHEKHLYIAPVKEKKTKTKGVTGKKFSNEVEALFQGATMGVDIDAGDL